MARRSTLERHQYFIDNNSPGFIFYNSKIIRPVRARFLEVAPEAIHFSIPNWKEEEIAVEVAEQVLTFLIHSTPIQLSPDNKFLQSFTLNIGGHLKTVVGDFKLLEEGLYYYVRLINIM